MRTPSTEEASGRHDIEREMPRTRLSRPHRWNVSRKWPAECWSTRAFLGYPARGTPWRRAVPSVAWRRDRRSPRHQRHPVLQRQPPRSAQTDRIDSPAPWRGDQRVELSRAQPGERACSRGFRHRDHTSHGTAVSPLTSSYGTTSRALPLAGERPRTPGPPDRRRLRPNGRSGRWLIRA